MQEFIGFSWADDVHAAFEVLRHFGHRRQLLLGVLMQVQWHHDVVVSRVLDAAFLGDDERRRTVGDNAQGTATGQKLHALQPMCTHDDQVGILLHGNIVNVFKNGTDAHGGAHLVGVVALGLFFPRLHAQPRIGHFLLGTDDVKQQDFTFECLPYDDCVFQCNVTHWGKVHRDEDAVLCHFRVDQFLNEGSS